MYLYDENIQENSTIVIKLNYHVNLSLLFSFQAVGQKTDVVSRLKRNYDYGTGSGYDLDTVLMMAVSYIHICI